MPTSRNSADFTPAWPTTYMAAPAVPSSSSTAKPIMNRPTWAIVE
jgi:hypothetical protein